MIRGPDPAGSSLTTDREGGTRMIRPADHSGHTAAAVPSGQAAGATTRGTGDGSSRTAPVRWAMAHVVSTNATGIVTATATGGASCSGSDNGVTSSQTTAVRTRIVVRLATR